MHLFAGFSFGCSSDTTRMSVIPEPHVNRKEFSNPRQTYKSRMREIKIEKHRKYKNFTNHHPIPPWRPIHCEVWRLDNCEYLVLRWKVVTGQCGGGAETGNILRRLDLTTIILPRSLTWSYNKHKLYQPTRFIDNWAQLMISSWIFFFCFLVLMLAGTTLWLILMFHLENGNKMSHIQTE